MYKEMIKKILKFTLYTLVFIIISLITLLSYLYYSADMLTPEYTSETKIELIQRDSLRVYGKDSLRQSESGLWEIKISGNDFERGEAIGKLTSDLLYYQEKVFVDRIKEMIPSERYLSFLRFCTVIFNRNLGKNTPEEFRNEIYGISLSCTDEFNVIGSPYERQLNYHAAHDIGHAMQDYMLVGCSSFAIWGENTEDSSLIIGRNFDFYMDDNFARNKLVSFYNPEQGYKFASIGWPGMIGVVSGMNEKGLSVSINAAKSTIPLASATPISILTREILQYASNINEAYEIAKNRKTFVAESILIGSAIDKKAAIIEKSPNKIDIFWGDNQQIICTNHYQSETFKTDSKNLENIKNSDSKYRYLRLEELLKKKNKIDREQTASILRNHKGIDEEELGLTNEMAINQFIAHHSVIFQPEQLLMWVSTHPWQTGKYVAYDLKKIFENELDFSKGIQIEEFIIEEDKFIHGEEFKQLIEYKSLKTQILKKIENKENIDKDIIDKFKNSNPNLFYTHEILGDYFKSQGDKENAKSHWEEALRLPIPRESERKSIKNKIKKL